MRVLIDECLNWRLSRALPGHYCASVQRMDGSGTQNGALLKLAADDRFDVFLTGDRNLAFQQSVAGLPLAVVVLEAKGTELRDTMPLMSKVLAILPTLQPGQIARVSA
jgi:hypothetical protein